MLRGANWSEPLFLMNDILQASDLEQIDKTGISVLCRTGKSWLQKCFENKLLYWEKMASYMIDQHCRGGEWSFNISESRKMLVEFHGSRSSIF